MTCATCDTAAVSALVALESPLGPVTGPCTIVQLKACPECCLCYLVTERIGLDEYMHGIEGHVTLDRLTREQSDVVHAVLGRRAEPAAIEDAFFALPRSVFGKTLQAAYRKDRDFVALFIPRLVQAWATGAHDVRSTLYALVDQAPSFGREVLAAASSLPPQLRDKLERLEQHCVDSLGGRDSPSARPDPVHVAIPAWQQPFRRLQYGMSYDGMVAVVGVPDRSSATEKEIHTYFAAPGVEVTVIMAPALVGVHALADGKYVTIL